MATCGASGVATAARTNFSLQATLPTTHAIMAVGRVSSNSVSPTTTVAIT